MGSICKSDLNCTGMTSFKSFHQLWSSLLKSLSCISQNLYWNHFQVFHHRAGRLEQLDHLWVFSHFIIEHRAGRLEQLDHLRIFLAFLSSSRSPGTMRPLASFLAFYHRVGCLKKWDHSRNPSRFFFLSGRSPGTIRQLAKPFSCFILHRAGHLEKWDHLQNSNFIFDQTNSFSIIENSKNIWGPSLI